MAINQLPDHAFTGRRVTIDPPAERLLQLVAQCMSTPLELLHVEGHNYLYDRKRDKIILGLEGDIKVPKKGWDMKETKFSRLYTELSDKELAVELHALPAEIAKINLACLNDVIRNTFSREELQALIHQDAKAPSDEEMRTRLHIATNNDGERVYHAMATLSNLSSETTRESVARAFGITLTPEDFSSFDRLRSERTRTHEQDCKRLEDKCKQAEKAHPVTYTTRSLKEHQTQEVAQHEFSLTEGGIIGTDFLQQCVAVVVHDPRRKRATLAHVDKVTDVTSLKTMFDIMDAGHPLDVYLVGSQGVNRVTAGKILEQVEKHTAETGRKINLRGVDFKCRSEMCFDSANGQIIPQAPHRCPGLNIDDPRIVSPLIPNNIQGMTIKDFGGSTDDFHTWLQTNAKAIANDSGIRLAAGATSQSVAKAPLRDLPHDTRELAHTGEKRQHP